MIAPKIGEVYIMEFTGLGCVQRGKRPGVVVQNNIGNIYSPNVIALPITSAMKKLGQPTHVKLLSRDTGLKLDSIVLCENPETISKQHIGNYITTLSDNDMRRIAEGHLLASAAISFLDEESLTRIWQLASKMNANTVPSC